MLIALVLAHNRLSLLETLQDPQLRARLCRFVNRGVANDSDFVPRFLRAILAPEPWLALNDLRDEDLFVWQAELCAVLQHPATYHMSGKLPWRPAKHLACLRALSLKHAGSRDTAVYVGLVWQRYAMPPELLFAVVEYLTRA